MIGTSLRRRGQRISRQFSELYAAVPNVVAHRVARMAAAGLTPDSDHWQETWLMSSEKVSAFNESWLAMWSQALRSQQEIALASIRNFGSPTWGMQSVGQSVQAMQSAALGVMGQGLAPVHRRALANAKRLAQTKR
jgi:hypothetical protein